MTRAIIAPSPRLGYLIREVVPELDVSEAQGRKRVRLHLLPFLRLRGRVVILSGDVGYLALRPKPMPDPDADGKATLRDAWPGRTRLSFTEFARDIGLSIRSVQRLRSTDPTFPVVVDELGRPALDVVALRAWLLERRTPARWETENETETGR